MTSGVLLYSRPRRIQTCRNPKSGHRQSLSTIQRHAGVLSGVRTGILGGLEHEPVCSTDSGLWRSGSGADHASPTHSRRKTAEKAELLDLPCLCPWHLASGARTGPPAPLAMAHRMASLRSRGCVLCEITRPARSLGLARSPELLWHADTRDPAQVLLELHRPKLLQGKALRAMYRPTRRMIWTSERLRTIARPSPKFQRGEGPDEASASARESRS